MENNDKLLEPLSAYEKYYEKLFEENAAAYFDELVKRSNVNVEQNRKTVREYNEELAHANKAGSSLNAQKAWRVLCIVLCVLGFLVAAIGIVVLALGNILAGTIMLVVGALVGTGMILIIKLVIAPKIKKLQKEFAEKHAKAEKLLKIAWGQMQCLNKLYESNATKQLIEKTVPLLTIDDNFSMRRYDYLCGKYGFGDNLDEQRSTLAIISGEIMGNPFVIDRELVQSMRSKTYVGTMIIHWTTSYTDSDGKRHTVHHSQTLTASVDKPCPHYSEQTRLIYGNDAAPDLIFSHEPTHAEGWSEKKLEHKVKSGTRDIQKLQKKELKTGGGTFTEMANSEFDVLFNAFDRNNEVQFRLLFTPLAQKNMLALMKDGNHFGDDFYFNKRKCLNYITSEHSAKWDLDVNYRRYYSFDIDAARKKFMTFNTEYFKNLYFDFAPLLSIPLYQQHKPQEYIYRENYERNFTSYETECAVNRIGEREFASLDAATRTILKTQFLNKDGQSDAVGVTAHSFSVHHRVDLVPVLGGDGHIHAVPVPWDEYLPVSKSSTVKLKQLNITDKDFDNNMSSDSPLRTLLGSFGNFAYGKGVLCCKVKDCDTPFDSCFNQIKLN